MHGPPRFLVQTEDGALHAYYREDILRIDLDKPGTPTKTSLPAPRSVPHCFVPSNRNTRPNHQADRLNRTCNSRSSMKGLSLTITKTQSNNRPESTGHEHKTSHHRFPVNDGRQNNTLRDLPRHPS